MDKSNTDDFAERTADMMESTKRYRESESNTDFEKMLHKSLLLGGVNESTPAFPLAHDTILLAHNQSLEAAVRAARIEGAIAELHHVHRAGGAEDADNDTDEYIDGRIEFLKAEFQALPPLDIATSETPNPELFGNVSGSRNPKED